MMPKEFEDDWWVALNAALGSGDRFLRGDQLDAALNHIVRLFTDSVTLLRSGSHASATFFAITALEETAKVHVGFYRRAEKAEDAPKRRRDPLFGHRSKHLLAAAPTIAMGSRLQRTIGDKRMHELMEMAANGGLVALREGSIYLDQKDKKLAVPQDAVSPKLACELILFAIEAFDDALVGYTSHSHALVERTDGLFAEVVGAAGG